MFKLFQLKLKKELEELKSIHAIEIKSREAEFEIAKRGYQADHNVKLKALESNHDLKLTEVTTLLRLESEQKVKKLALEYESKLNAVKADSQNEITAFKEKALAENYSRLTAAMTKLHEEGNVTTKFTQDLALQMFGSMPEHKTQVKVLTKGNE